MLAQGWVRGGAFIAVLRCAACGSYGSSRPRLQQAPRLQLLGLPAELLVHRRHGRAQARVVHAAPQAQLEHALGDLGRTRVGKEL